MAHPPMFADVVVNNPVLPFIVVISFVVDELNFNPVEFNIYPAPESVPPLIVPEYKDPPEIIPTLPAKYPPLAVMSPSIVNFAPSHKI